MKNIYFERKNFFNKKKDIYIADWCLSDKELLKYQVGSKSKYLVSYQLNNHQKIIISKYLSKIINIQFKKIYKKINKYHDLKNSSRYWRIILLPFLNLVIPFIFIRWRIIELIKNKNKYLANIYEINDQEFAFNSLSDMKFDSSLSSLIFSKIIEYRNDLKYIKKNNFKKNKLNLKNNLSKIINFLNLKITNFINNLSSIFFKNKFLLINIGLPFFRTILLNLSLKQFPYIWREILNNTQEFNFERRKMLISKKKGNNFNNFIDTLIYLLIPKNYIENYQTIIKSLPKFQFSKETKIITAYNYKNDDQFKILVAEMKKRFDCKYYILQHGGGYGIDKFINEEMYIKKIADKFLTWGWRDEKIKNIKSFFYLKYYNKNLFSDVNLTNKILFIYHYFEKYPLRVTSQPNTNSERIKNILKIIKFFNLIDDNIIFKKYPFTLRYIKKDEKFWNQNFNENIFPKGVNFDDGKLELLDAIKKNKYRLIIHDSNSTTFLETMFYNVPSIVILNTKIQTTRKEFNFFNDQFFKNKIFFSSELMAARFVNLNIANIQEWWFSNNIQRLRTSFCDNYIKTSTNIKNEFLKLLI